MAPDLPITHARILFESSPQPYSRLIPTHICTGLWIKSPGPGCSTRRLTKQCKGAPANSRCALNMHCRITRTNQVLLATTMAITSTYDRIVRVPIILHNAARSVPPRDLQYCNCVRTVINNTDRVPYPDRVEMNIVITLLRFASMPDLVL